jgi:hypothetical protein
MSSSCKIKNFIDNKVNKNINSDKENMKKDGT